VRLAGGRLTDAQGSAIVTHEGEMRTKLEIDDDLMRRALRASGERTKRAVVERGLRLLVALAGQGTILRLKGRVDWGGGLEVSRRGRAAR
jgi:Arc/MetJ family transcription regulator